MKSVFLKAIVLFAAIVNMAGCAKLALPSGTPSCIRAKIKEIQSEKVRNPPGSIWQYEYKGQTVYYVTSYCCDFPSQLYDTNCNLICSPDGGYTGKGDGKCPEFFAERKNEKLIWKDDRK